MIKTLLSLNAREILRVCYQIAIIEILVELFIMFLVLPALRIHFNLTQYWENIFDPLILVMVTTPLIFSFVIKPYKIGRDLAEEELIKLKNIQENNHKDATKQMRDYAEDLQKAMSVANSELSKSERRYELATQATKDGLWDWDVTTNTIYYTERWKAIIGFTNDEFPNDVDSWLRRIHPEDQALVMEMVLGSQCRSNNEPFSCEYRIMHKDESYVWVQNQWLVVQENDHVRVVGSESDISERKRMEEKFIHDALHDGLTGLPNRNLLNERLSQLLLNYKRDPSKKFALLFVDVDNFKRVNDTMGHNFGDLLLINIAQRLRESVREVDTVARLGGDEFAILITEAENRDSLEELILRILANVKRPMNIKKQKVAQDISVGVLFSDASHRYSTPESILADADMALYRTKENAKGRYTFFDENMHNDILQHFEIGNNLKDALEHQQIELYYQPIVNIDKDKVAGFEALMRWNHPKYGVISPASFIPVAEESDIIHHLGKYTINTAIEQIKKWSQVFERDDWYISINVSGKQLERDDVLKQLEEAIVENNIKPENVQIEITESVLYANADRVLILLEGFKKLGVRLAIDDFGAGYSSLGTFSKYPFDVIKIDKAFIDDIDANDKSAMMVQVIHALAETLNLAVIAEGVEKSTQVSALKKLGCFNIQGYYFSKPTNATQMQSFLERGAIPSQWNPINANILETKKIEELKTKK